MNLDLIWGLPHQSEKTIENTIELVKKLRPERISYYSYAHLPELFSHQRLIKEEHLLNGKAKRALYEAGKRLLFEAGYREIGMDHYALEDTSLARAAKERRLQRNFMGYTDIASTNLVGFGASSISQVKGTFVQNAKDIPSYETAILRGGLAIEKGHFAAKEDHLRGKIIQNLMCNMVIRLEDLQKLNNKPELLDHLKGLRADGLIDHHTEGWEVTEIGKTFIRTIASSFDEYFAKAGKERFSRTV